LVICSIG
jgi:hypothetical protein